MCQKGNDLARFYLWNAARVAIRHNPAIRALYSRLKSRGKRGDVALGHCMRKLLHLVFAVWKTDLPFNADHYPWENPAGAQPASAPATDAVATEDEKKMAAGHKQDVPAEKVVTSATSSLQPAAVPIKPPARTRQTKRPVVDYEYLRQQLTMSQIIEHLGLQGQLQGRGQQLRGPCPVHSQPTKPSRTFSVHLGKNVFRCFHADCGIQGNVLDLWAAVHRLPLYEAALHMAETLGLPRNREEEPVNAAIDPPRAEARKGGT
jgi:hypothetical protein